LVRVIAMYGNLICTWGVTVWHSPVLLVTVE
jgi:hypothetical protein